MSFHKYIKYDLSESHLSVAPTLSPQPGAQTLHHKKASSRAAVPERIERPHNLSQAHRPGQARQVINAIVVQKLRCPVHASFRLGGTGARFRSGTSRVKLGDPCVTVRAIHRCEPLRVNGPVFLTRAKCSLSTSGA